MLAACAPPLVVRRGPVRQWEQAQEAASRALAAGRYADADQVLHEFIQRDPTRAETADAWLWLGALRSDPLNKGGKLADALAALDSAIARGAERPAGSTAAVLKRQVNLAEGATKELDQARKALADARQAVAAAGSKPAPATNVADEVERLKAELAKANEELARVKRTLRQRRP